jgi:NAD(P)-dependent dehydrogenase (short-subunit alcohol dehydrogenase family)
MLKLFCNSQCNERFVTEHHEEGLVCVFAGATSGIGASTLEKMATLLHAPTFYVIGRSAEHFSSQRVKLEKLNPTCKIVFLEAEVSLISDVDAVCKQITDAEKKVDYLFMSPGMLPFNGAQCRQLLTLGPCSTLTACTDTKEGLETSFALSYYSRIRITQNLLPLLRHSPHPRVLSVLNAGKEKTMLEDDLGLEQHWSSGNLMNHTVTMTSLAFKYLAEDENNKNILFLHATPGLVHTEIYSKLTAPESSGYAWKTTLPLLKGLLSVLWFCFAISVEESGERQAYNLTSDAYGPGAWRIDQSNELISTPGVLEQYIERGWQEKVWEHTVRVFEKAAAME